MDDVEKIVRRDHNIVWLPQPNEGIMVLSSQLPPVELITTAFAFVFEGDCLLMTHLVKRGWDIPGGHVEVGEHPEQAVRRELMEETGATLAELHLLGYQHLRILGPWPEGYRYPYPDTYQVFYWARVAALQDIFPNAETHGRGLFTPEEALSLAWVQQNHDFYNAAYMSLRIERE